MVFELLNAGLLHDENGKLSNRMRIKALDLLGFGIWENAQDINELHTKRASQENYDIVKGKSVSVKEIDNHDLHINEHIAYVLSSEFSNKSKHSEQIEQQILNHIKQHKNFKALEAMVANSANQGE